MRREEKGGRREEDGGEGRRARGAAWGHFKTKVAKIIVFYSTFAI